MEPQAILFLLRSTYHFLPNATNLKLWGYTDSDLCLCKCDRGTLHHVLSACPQSLQMYTWWHNKFLEVVIQLLRAQCETAICYSQGTHNSVSQGRWMSCEETKNRNMKLLNGASDWKVSVDLKTSLQFPIHITQTEKRPNIVAWSDSECPPHRIDCPLGRKPWGSTRAEEKPMRDTACRLRGKGLDMLCDSYCGWLLWFSRTLSFRFFQK